MKVDFMIEIIINMLLVRVVIVFGTYKLMKLMENIVNVHPTVLAMLWNIHLRKLLSPIAIRLI